MLHHKSNLPPGKTLDSLSEEELICYVRDHPADADGYAHLGGIAQRQGKFTFAAEQFEKALLYRPNQPQFIERAARCYTAADRHHDATEHWSRLAKLLPAPPVFVEWGNSLTREEKYSEALDAFGEALARQPDAPLLHILRGESLMQLRDPGKAIEEYRRALRLTPNSTVALNNLGLALHQIGQTDEAISAWQQVLRLDPKHNLAAINLGMRLRDKGRLDEALACFRETARHHPRDGQTRFQIALTLVRQNKITDAIIDLQNCLLFIKAPEPYFHLGVLFGQVNKLEESTAAFRQALQQRSDHAQYLYHLGYALVRQQQWDEAIVHLKRATELRAGHAASWFQFGVALIELGRFEEALDRLHETLRLHPNSAEGILHLGIAQRRLRRYDEALASYQRVLQIDPNDLGARLNIGILHTECGQFAQAITCLGEFHTRHPKVGEACNYLAIAHLHQGFPADALGWFDKAIACRPKEGEFHLNRALCLLQMGDFARGWPEYEARWHVKRSTPCPLKLPRWDGSPMPNGTVVLWFEQGMGDTIQFIRYAPLVKQRVGKVIFVCPTPLRSLVATCPGIDEILVEGGLHPNADVQCPLLSLPRLFGATLETIPHEVPYFSVPDEPRKKWREKIGSGREVKIGLVWQGNPKHTGDHYRSVPLEMFRPLAQVPGVRLFSLQKGFGSEQLAPLAEELKITDLGSQISSEYLDTAAAVLELDLVITIDSSVGHLVGALGKPVWLLLALNNDWRWLQHRSDSPWYPSVRLFRQSRWADWGDVVQRVVTALTALAAQPQPRCASVQVPLVDLFEQSVREELHGGEESRAALARSGLRDSDQIGPLVTRLKSALETMETVEKAMCSLADGDDSARSADLVRRFARARQERKEVLAAFVNWANPEPGIVIPGASE